MTPEEIKEAMQRRGLKNREVAAAVKMDENHLTKSLGPQRRRFTVDEMDRIRAYFGRLDAADQGQPIRSIPILGDVPGGRFQWNEQRPIGRLPVDADIPRNAYALKISGDSMDQIAPNGGTVIVNPDDIDLWEGRFFIFRTEDGETTFKQFRSDPARLVPCSSNDEHKEIPVGMQPLDITILGRVVAVIQRLP